ncbi:MAG TPA: penicillin-binding transpeptidase domain-containing protein [Ktedonobacterales bacterium]|nr:penicillin-binding transpeptidase domain-containing protein [Ktedonobacterales bacterium]
MAEDEQSAAGSSDERGAGQAASGDDNGARELVPVNAGSPPSSSGLDERTVDLPPEAIIGMNQKAPPQRGAARHSARPAGRPAGPTGWRRPPLWAYLLTTALVVAIVAGAAYAIIGPNRQTSGVNDINGCASGSPCQVANSYLAAYTGGKYAAMYGLTSAASRTRFSAPAILHAAAKYAINPVDYTSAQEYMTTRTQGIIGQAQVYSMSATLGAVKKVDATHVSFPARVIMRSVSLGDVTVDITLPLTLEHNAWRVDWSPGLIFPQLDDATDPNYTHLVRFTPLTANRGTIYSSDDQPLALDETAYVVGVVPAKMTDANAVTQALIKNLDLTAPEVTSAYQGKDANTFWPVRTITPMLYTQVSSALNVPGIQTQQTTGRVYPFGTTMAPITGYLGQVSPKEISADASHYYQSGDEIGRAGVEQWAENYLRPTKGGRLDVRARNGDGSDGPTVTNIVERAAQNGESIYTTINIATQQTAMTTLAQQGHAGGAVALAPTTGDVLAMASYPTYDPNDFSLGFTANEQARFNALSSPYLNRATMAADPTGSIFKLVTLSADLEHGIGPSYVFTCPGYYQVPGTTTILHDDFPAGHGSLTAPDAIGPSCDVVFWKSAVMLNQQDPNILPNVAKGFGLGAPTGMIGLPSDEDNPGIVPDPAWLKANKNATWTAVDAANLGIGQGFFEATPAQIAQMTASIANNGVRMRPRLVTKLVDANGATTKTFAPEQAGVDPISAPNVQVVQVAMLGPIYSPGGTSTKSWVGYPVTVAGKTGTAESGQPNPHAWFTCYAPAQKLSGPPVTPQIAVATLVEFSGFGDTFAAPVSKAIMSAYLHIGS